jgi:hypothetical protein
MTTNNTTPQPLTRDEARYYATYLQQEDAAKLMATLDALDEARAAAAEQERQAVAQFERLTDELHKVAKERDEARATANGDAQRAAAYARERDEARAEATRLTDAARKAWRAMTEGDIAPADTGLAEALSGAPDADRIRSVSELGTKVIVLGARVAELERERDAARAELAQARETIQRLSREDEALLAQATARADEADKRCEDAMARLLAMRATMEQLRDGYTHNDECRADDPDECGDPDNCQTCALDAALSDEPSAAAAFLERIRAEACGCNCHVAGSGVPRHDNCADCREDLDEEAHDIERRTMERVKAEAMAEAAAAVGVMPLPDPRLGSHEETQAWLMARGAAVALLYSLASPAPSPATPSEPRPLEHFAIWGTNIDEQIGCITAHDPVEAQREVDDDGDGATVRPMPRDACPVCNDRESDDATPTDSTEGRGR